MGHFTNGTHLHEIPYTFFQIYFMMAGEHKTENMGIETLTWPNSMTFFLYFIFMFLMSTLTFNIFTGIAISEIQGIIDDSNIQTMKEKIDYIYDGGYSIFFLLEKIKRVKKIKKKVFGIVIQVFVWLGKLIKKIVSFCGGGRDHFVLWLKMLWLKCFPRKKADVPDERKSIKKINTTQAEFIDDKYIEYFEDIENRTKNLEEKLYLNNKNLSETIETRIKNLEEKLHLNNKGLSDTIESRTKNLEEKLDQILNDKNLSETIETRNKNLEEKMHLNNYNLSETIENRIKDLEEKLHLNNNNVSETIKNRTKNLEDKLDQILTSLLSQK